MDGAAPCSIIRTYTMCTRAGWLCHMEVSDISPIHAGFTRTQVVLAKAVFNYEDRIIGYGPCNIRLLPHS